MSRRYQVTIRKAFPAHDEREGLTYEIEAKDKAQAIRYGRRQASDDGHVGAEQGRYAISAKEVQDE